MAIHKDSRDFLSMVDSIQSRYLQIVVDQQKDDDPKAAEELRSTEAATKSDHYNGSQPGALRASKPQR
jgi:hypothetical protein